MKTRNYTLALLILMVSFVIASCSPGKGDLRDRNLEQATLARLDSIPGIQYVGMSDTHVLGYVKQKVNDKMEEKGIDLDGSLIDALIELRKK